MAFTQHKDLIDSLLEYGLSDKEALTYVALLENGDSTAQTLAKITGIKRATTYFICESLMAEGFAKKRADKKVQMFMAESPEVLHRFADMKVKKLQNMQKNLKDTVLKLENMRSVQENKPLVTMYEGKKGVINAFEDTLTNKEKKIRVMSSACVLGKLMPDYIVEYMKKRTSLKIKMTGIHPFDKSFIEMMRYAPSFDESVAIPAEKYNFPAEVAIYDNKIGYVSPNNGGVSVIIENKDIAGIMRSLFDLAFEEAKRLNKKVSKPRRNQNSKRR